MPVTDTLPDEDVKWLLSLLLDDSRLERLLKLEKRRRGLDESRLVFVGTADIAGYWWCAEKSVFQNERMEKAFFAAYLEDRILYSIALGRIRRIPRDEIALLEIGDDITRDDIERLLTARAAELREREPAGGAPDRWRTVARIKRAFSLPPKRRGDRLERLLGRKYPSIRWNFQWREYVVLGIPDGITDELVYEFKTTQSDFLLRFVWPVARAQADLYGYFFRRQRKVIDIVVDEPNGIKIEIDDSPVSVVNAEETLRAFAEVVEGVAPRPPQRWKCKSCEFRGRCPLISK